MLTLRADKWLSVGAGFGLLLLISAQQRFCPWLMTTPPPEPGTEAAPAERTAGSSERSEHKRPQSRLPYLLPDSNAATPRGTAGSSQAALRLRNGWCDGICSCGPRQALAGSPNLPPAIPPDHLAWHCFQQPVAPPLLTVGERARPGADPAIATCIARTGPPRA